MSHTGLSADLSQSVPAPRAPGMTVQPGHPVPGGSPFPPIADYAFLSDCEVSALVASSGAIEWMCLPRMDGPSVFGAVLDRGAGSFRLGPADVRVPSGRRYLPGTMIVETTWATATGWAVVRDALEEGTFTICSFWLVSALTEIGEVPRARALCEKLLSYASPLHLYAEEIEHHSGQHLGNFPQAFSHLALINAVMHLVREDERAGDRTSQTAL